MPFILLVLLIVVHELGHFLCALLFKAEIDKIYIYPFGGIAKFHLNLNESLYKELFILLMGPFFQILCYFILIHISYLNSYADLIRIYHYTILFFNLLPIYPLDGGKLLNIFFSFQFSFKKSLSFVLTISYLTVFLLFVHMTFQNFSLNMMIIISFLLYKVRIEEKKKKYLVDKFLLERYLHHYHFKKRKEVERIDDFMRDRYHIIKVGNKYYTEKEILNKKFSK